MHLKHLAQLGKLVDLLNLQFFRLTNLFHSIYSLHLFIHMVNAVAKEISFHFFSHQDFCRNGRKPNHWYDGNLDV